MVDHELLLKPGDTLTVTVAHPNDYSTTAPRNSNNNNNNDDEFKIAGGGRRGKKTRKIGGKRGANGFMKFAKEKRPEVMRENPGIAFGDVGKRLGEKWRALSAAEKARY